MSSTRRMPATVSRPSKVVDRGDGLLAPAAQTTDAAGLGSLVGLGRIVEVAEVAIDQRGGLA